MRSLRPPDLTPQKSWVGHRDPMQGTTGLQPKPATPHASYTMRIHLKAVQS